MRMIRRCVLYLVIMLLITFFAIPQVVFADTPYKAWTPNYKNKLVPTVVPYEPVGVIEGGFQSPEDLYIAQNGDIYIADSGNARIVAFDKDGNLIKEIGEGVLNRPTGVFVDDNKFVYVADYGNEKVYIFDDVGRLINAFGRPNSPLYGKRSQFKPRKLVVDKRYNIYIVSEGSTEGLVQLNVAGEFVGFYGVNESEASLKRILQGLLYTEAQLNQLFKILPPSPNNIDIDDDAIIYTVTRGADKDNLKKLNIAGQNMLKTVEIDSDMSLASNAVDVTVSKYGNIYVVNEDGYIMEYDSYGNLMFVFGGKSNNEDSAQRFGFLSDPKAIEIDNNDMLYLLDGTNNIVLLYRPTEFAQNVHQALYMYRQGLYVESQQLWHNVLKWNSNFTIAHDSIAKAYYKEQKYKEAMAEFRLANNKSGYSEAFWEVRQDFLSNWLSLILGVLLSVTVLIAILKRINMVNDAARSFSKRVMERINKSKLLSDLLFAFNFVSHPIDAYYSLRWENKGSILSGAILYIVFFVEYVLSIFLTGYLFNNNDLLNISLTSVLVTVFVPIILWFNSNYLVSAINEGEGRYRDIYIGTAYALAPYIIFTIPLILLSNVLTYNEAFVYDLCFYLMILWCAILFFIMVSVVHDYSFGQTIGNILLTIFAMLIIIFIVFVLYLIFNQLYQFIYSIIQEVMVRV
ncbi:YIP1 family protein [Mahella sp.]|uniref:YIP1 family protein n=1 Tax=Mahella sp. TaxID=2798721 RepID=UPI0025C60526|nr:YIP1 family protein [Mahella sp.]MBZ4665290.1 hypothetical protein [Mahella sp.]